MRFKVGDKVRVKNNLEANKCYGGIIFVESMKKYLGKSAKVTSANGGYYTLNGWRALFPWAFSDEMLEPDVLDNKIVITSDGEKTKARLYEGKNVVKESVSKCCKEDKFDFMTGAEIAFERLKGHKYYSGKVVCVKSDGDFVVGKVYTVTDGKMVDESGEIRPVGYKLSKIEDYEKNTTLYKFIELVEE